MAPADVGRVQMGSGVTPWGDLRTTVRRRSSGAPRRRSAIPHIFMDSGVSWHYPVGMVTFCKNCGKVFVSVPRPGFLSLRLLRCKCGHSQVFAVQSLIETPAVPTGGRAFPGLPESPPPL